VACGRTLQVAVARRTLQNKRLRIALAINQFTPDPWEAASPSFPTGLRYFKKLAAGRNSLGFLSLFFPFP
jgi:hypothetical protein